MSTEIKGLLITFTQDVSEEYADKIKSIIEMINNVHEVATISFIDVDFSDYINRTVIKTELINKVVDMLREEK